MTDTSDGFPWTPEERVLFDGLGTPERVQAFLDAVPYSAEHCYRCPRSVMGDRLAHCFDGAVFAAAAFRYHGLPPHIVDLRADRDDDHVIAVFRRYGAWGAVAKSNVVGLRYREPIYRTLRELVMGYFDEYANLERIKSLRSFSRPVNLARYDRAGWQHRDDVMEAIAERLDRVPHTDLLTPEMVAGLLPVEERRFRASLLGADEAGLYKPWEHDTNP